MKLLPSLALALVVAAACTAASASQGDPHKAGHPAPAAAESKPGMPAAMGMHAAGPACHDMQSMHAMDAQMLEMRQMHEAMLAARTPAQRKAMMARHAKMMQDGMKMLEDMSPGDGKGAMDCDMAERHRQMEKRLQMMQSMMQMMMDRMPPATSD
jgi:hypothetical protein